MKIRFARWLAGAVLVLAAVLIVLGLESLRLSGWESAIPLTAAGGICCIVGLLYLGPIGYFAVRDQEVVGPVMLGRIPRTSLAPDERLAEEDGRLTIVHRAQEPTRLGIYRWMAHRADWNALLADDAVYD